MKKAIYTLFLMLACCAFVLSGCGKAEITDQIFEKNAFRILRQTEADGRISLSYIFPVNSDKLRSLNFDDTDAKIYRFYLSTYVSALAQKYQEGANDGTKVSRCVYYTDVDGVGFVMEFDSVEAQKEFFKVEESESAPNTETSGFFIKKMSVKTKFPVSTEESAKNMKQVCELAASAWGAQNQIDGQKLEAFLSALEGSVFIYDTAAPGGKLKSESMYEANGKTHNVFIKSQKDIAENGEIEFFVTYPNTATWYLAALTVVPIGMVVVYLWKRKGKQPAKGA